MEDIEKGRKNPTIEDSIVKGKLKIEKRKGVTRGALIAGIAGFCMLVVAGVIAYSVFNKEYNKQQAAIENQRNDFTKLVTSRDSIINEWLVTFDQIEKDLNMIKQKEKLITFKPTEGEFSKSRREQILEDIRYINTLLENNKKKISSLSAQLNNSGGTIKGLQTRISGLEATIKQYEADVTDMKSTLAKKNFEIGELNNKMTALEATVTQRDNDITDQTNRMNQVYLVTGTVRELKTKGIISKEGGFLGIGKTEVLVRDVNDTLFSKLDMRQLSSIPVNSRNAKLITRHPANSYTIIHEGDNKIASIEIKDPGNFWKLSRYAVVEITK